jgi:urease accessory protein
MADLLQFDRRIPHGQPTDHLALPFELRQKSRLRVRLSSGREAGIFLPRGTVLRDGDLLYATTGEILRIIAAPEPVSRVCSPDPAQLARVCYHLGNRHVPLMIGADGCARYLCDHVLDEMVLGLGLVVVHEDAPFDPEPGAYAGGHRHGHGHQHEH